MKKLYLGLAILGVFILGACNANTRSDSSKTSISSTKETKISSTKTSLSSTSESSISTSTTSKAQETSDSSTNSSLTADTTNYQSILSEYTLKIQDATPGLIQEFRNEASTNTSGIDGLAAISNNKVEKLAIISTDGVNQMANLHYSLSDDYSIYESWANQLITIYTEESQKIIGEYLASSAATNSAHTGITTISPDTQAQTTPSSEPTVTTTVQAGESPQDIATRSGISMDALFNLNGMDPNNYMLYPGQELRIK